MKQTGKIGRAFDARAIHYDNPVTAFIGEQELRAIRPLVPPNSDVLDYGCGTGRTTLDHLRRRCRVTAFDLSPAMLARAREKAQQVGLTAEFVTDESQLARRTWPIVTCIGVLDYYPDPVPLLRALGQYLEPGGRLIVTFPNVLSPIGWVYALLSRFTVMAVPRSPWFARKAVAQAGLCSFAFRYAFPALRPVGYTLVLGLSRLGD